MELQQWVASREIPPTDDDHLAYLALSHFMRCSFAVHQDNLDSVDPTEWPSKIDAYDTFASDPQTKLPQNCNMLVMAVGHKLITLLQAEQPNADNRLATSTDLLTQRTNLYLCSATEQRVLHKEVSTENPDPSVEFQKIGSPLVAAFMEEAIHADVLPAPEAGWAYPPGAELIRNVYTLGQKVEELLGPHQSELYGLTTWTLEDSSAVPTVFSAHRHGLPGAEWYWVRTYPNFPAYPEHAANTLELNWSLLDSKVQPERVKVGNYQDRKWNSKLATVEDTDNFSRLVLNKEHVQAFDPQFYRVESRKGQLAIVRHWPHRRLRHALVHLAGRRC